MPVWMTREGDLHWLVFAFGFLAVGLWETYRPFRALIESNTKRWAAHIVLASLGHLSIILTPISATLVAVAAAASPFGLLNHTFLPYPVQCLLGFVLLDFVRWVQHCCFHKFSLLWRIHRVHHADPDYDLTTTLRFHPLEVLLTQGTYLAAVYLIAPPPPVALVVELFLIAQNFFGHANVALPTGFERQLRRFLVTPDMHRIHHSTRVAEQNSNFGTILPWWDRLSGCYIDAPAGGAANLSFGLDNYRGPRCVHLWHILLFPFRGLDHAEEPVSAPQPASPDAPACRTALTTTLR